MSACPYHRLGSVPPIFVPPQPVQVSLPDARLYETMGLEGWVELCSRFYEGLETSPIRPMFPENMQEGAKKLALFFVQISGGPPMYSQAHGPPMMRKRHFPFVITERERKIWLEAFVREIQRFDEKRFPPDLKRGFIDYITSFSAWMVNAVPEDLENG